MYGEEFDKSVTQGLQSWREKLIDINFIFAYLYHVWFVSYKNLNESQVNARMAQLVFYVAEVRL